MAQNGQIGEWSEHGVSHAHSAMAVRGSYPSRMAR